MATILLHLKGPMQSWSLDQAGDHNTEAQPTKTGIIGLIRTACGLPRKTHSPELYDLRMGVHTIQAGRRQWDFQTIQNAISANGKSWGTVIKRHEYLADAEFLVGLSGDETTLLKIKAALLNPVWLLGLGKRAYPASQPIFQALIEESIEDALPKPSEIEHPDGNIFRCDQPSMYGPIVRTTKRITEGT